MIYRAQDASGDYVAGQGRSTFLVNTPAAVAQAVKTRLRLLEGEWFLDVKEGTPYATQILGAGHAATADAAIRTRILETEGVTELVAYSSSFNPVTRKFSVSATIDTLYSQDNTSVAAVEVSL